MDARAKQPVSDAGQEIYEKLREAEAEAETSSLRYSSEEVRHALRATADGSGIERIEDELDLKAYEEAIAKFKKNPETYTLDEVERELY